MCRRAGCSFACIPCGPKVVPSPCRERAAQRPPRCELVAWWSLTVVAGHKPRAGAADWDASSTRHAWAPLYRCDLSVEGIHAGMSVRNDMPPDPLALRRYDEFGVTWPVPEETV